MNQIETGSVAPTKQRKSHWSKKESPIGKRFGKLEVVMHGGYYIYKNRDQRATLWVCKCDCGEERKWTLSEARKRASCGCILKPKLAETARARFTTHGKSRTPEYSAWEDMKRRCLNPNTKHYHRYGGRGISVCERWENSFENFFYDMGYRPPGTSLDRIKNDEGYSPDNCAWRTRKDQSNNTSRNRLLEYAGRTQTLAQWARELGVDAYVLKNRVRRSWNLEEVILKWYTQPASPA